MVCQENPALSVELLAPIISAGNAMTDKSFCLVHKKRCQLMTAQRHTAGNPCVPFSKRGVGLGLKDPATLSCLAWIGLRLLLQETDITQEILNLCISASFVHTTSLRLFTGLHIFFAK